MDDILTYKEFMEKKNKLFLKEFFKFLKENNAYNKYRFETRHQKRATTLVFKNEKLIAPIICVQNLITSTLLWRTTKDGDEYWENISRKWQQYFYTVMLPKIGDQINAYMMTTDGIIDKFFNEVLTMKKYNFSHED